MNMSDLLLYMHAFFGIPKLIWASKGYIMQTKVLPNIENTYVKKSIQFGVNACMRTYVGYKLVAITDRSVQSSGCAKYASPINLRQIVLFSANSLNYKLIY